MLLTQRCDAAPQLKPATIRDRQPRRQPSAIASQVLELRYPDSGVLSWTLNVSGLKPDILRPTLRNSSCRLRSSELLPCSFAASQQKNSGFLCSSGSVERHRFLMCGSFLPAVPCFWGQVALCSSSHFPGFRPRRPVAWMRWTSRPCTWTMTTSWGFRAGRPCQARSGLRCLRFSMVSPRSFARRTQKVAALLTLSGWPGLRFSRA